MNEESSKVTLYKEEITVIKINQGSDFLLQYVDSKGNIIGERKEKNPYYHCADIPEPNYPIRTIDKSFFESFRSNQKYE